MALAVQIFSEGFDPSFINAVFFQTMSNITKLQFLRICITTKNCLSIDIIPFLLFQFFYHEFPDEALNMVNIKVHIF